MGTWGDHPGTADSPQPERRPGGDAPAVLVVDDEADIRRLLRLYLKRAGFAVVEAGDGVSALAAFDALVRQGRAVAAVVLDLMLPGLDGWEVCERLRERSQVPILMLTARGEIHERLHGFHLGADDYVVKPFDPREVVARIRALSRRAAPAPGGVRPAGAEPALHFGRLTIDPGARTVTVDGHPVSLTRTEFDLLYTLAQHRGQTLSRQQILDRLRGGDYFGDERVIDSHIRNLREKLEPFGLRKLIATVWGVGYRFEG
ncbi:two component transcriptional regulator, winged helix family [Thermaerobacter marianensis DSM 12885]|uniref:Stage 0 sporulation protein A homolog n=1 Tax=Thermaerobacter marianensis (strain ATCC 700841 / DSM 12885 / JCM 10246 / 7p75a) TaxID=644966 RepID=E6SH57_THEM7|nr:response regulator transcription factor [Thermaerobacter marianensis]ADU51721.1 two component transcriptional regulator, winged helix family [Thermaerobacter marianensis DSM 12885]